MFKFFVQLYKSIELSTRLINLDLLMKMSEYKMGIARASIVAVLLVAFLGGVIYHSFPPETIPLQIVPSVAFGLIGVGEEATSEIPSADVEYENLTFSYDLLEFEFIFANESWIGFTFRSEEGFSLLGYEGEFAAASLERIVVRPLKVTVVDGFLARNMSLTFTIEVIRNYVLNAALEAMEITDLGTYENLNRNTTLVTVDNAVKFYEDKGDELCSGYWIPPRDWVISATQLSSMLQGSGTASITFDLTLSANINYDITREGNRETGETNLLGEGRLGTIEITYDQGEILWVRYDFQKIGLVLLTISR